MGFKLIILFITLLSASFTFQLNQVKQVISKARQNIWKEMDHNLSIWNFPSYAGTMFISQYHFQIQALNVSHISKFNPRFFKDKLIKSQLNDGSWKQIIDLNKQQGSLDTTIFNYWFLKDIGLSEDEQVLKKAKAFILSQGGLEASLLITKYKLAMFGQYQWDQLYSIPLYLFKNYWPFRWLYIKNYFSKEIYPLLTGLAYLKYHRTVFSVSKVCLNQLRINQNKTYCVKNNINNQTTIKQQPSSSVTNLIHQILILQGNRKSFGGYTTSNLINLLSLQHYYNKYRIRYNLGKHFAQQDQKYDKIKSIAFVQQHYFNKKAPYQGTLNDGKYMDTIICLTALLQSQEDPSKLYQTIEYLKQHTGKQGISQGQDLQYAPNIVYSSLLLSIYSKFNNKYQSQVQKIMKWMANMQNLDGGFPLYEINKNDNQYTLLSLILYLTGMYESLQFFDQSSADIVGHVLQSFGKFSNQFNNQKIYLAIQFLKNKQRIQGQWPTRGGINYIYGIGTVLPGLRIIGYNMSQNWIKKSVNFLIKHQQSDGGFGQDSRSYYLKYYKSGVTTATMTSWGLLALLEVEDYYPQVSINIQKAVRYLVNNFKQHNNKFFDRSTIKAKYRGILNIQIPSYVYSYPLIALSRYMKVKQNRYYSSKEIRFSEELKAIISKKNEQEL